MRSRPSAHEGLFCSRAGARHRRASSLRAMCTAHAPLDDDEEGEPRLTTTGYGYGLFAGIFAGHTAWYHPGDNSGYHSFACWIPDRAASIVISVNDEAANMTGLLRQLLPAALES